MRRGAVEFKNLVIVAIVAIVLGTIAGCVLLGLSDHPDTERVILQIVAIVTPVLVGLVALVKIQENTNLTQQTKDEGRQDRQVIHKKVEDMDDHLSSVQNKVAKIEEKVVKK